MRIPLDQIDPHALIRDRSALDSAAFEELKSSIAAHGLRQPVEVFETETGYGLLSGYRRLAAIRGLHDLTDDAKYADIEAVLRAPADQQAALAAMVEETTSASHCRHGSGPPSPSQPTDPGRLTRSTPP